MIDWGQGLCHSGKYDPELFFSDNDLEQELAATTICTPCPIKRECLDYALNLPEKFGVWGGMTEKARRKFSYAKHRVKCPRCTSSLVSTITVNVTDVEICGACGLSWRA